MTINNVRYRYVGRYLFTGRYYDVIIDDDGTTETVTADDIDEDMTDNVEATATLSQAAGLALTVS